MTRQIAMMTTTQCAGLPITPYPPDSAAGAIVALASSHAGGHVHLVNAWTVALADADPALHSVLCQAAVNFPDGMSVVWANRFRSRAGDPPMYRVPGPDLMQEVFKQGQERRVRHYLLGGSPETLQALHRQLLIRHRTALIVGSDSPPFRPLTQEDLDEQRRRIREAGPDVVWVGLGTPKQDWECARLAAETGALCIAIGAAFDFIAGTKRRAPRWMQNLGLEWLHRLAAEPRRLWRRYLFGNVAFIRACMRRRSGSASQTRCDDARPKGGLSAVVAPLSIPRQRTPETAREEENTAGQVKGGAHPGMR
jgi:N-acetylglucosaminyldiphosphoundecaprenol N-acetyl-beta-D-mannosaminyltransferase